MMKKVGYRSHVAGAIEATASTGGQLMPPIMGAGAFLMAEFTNTSYLTIIKVALVPAIMYYLTVLVFVHYEARKFGLKGQPKENLPKIRNVIKHGLHFIIPVIILIYVLVSNYSPMMAGFVAVISTLSISIVANFIHWTMNGRNETGLAGFGTAQLKSIVKALENGARNAVMVSVACAAAGIIVGMVSLTGMGLKFSSLVLELSFGIKVLAILLIGGASLVLGMGLPVTASYIVLATLAGPALLDMGVPIMAAHMIVFWYSQDANVTPPVSLASFAGAGIAKANPMKTALTSWKLAKGLYIIPIIMAYRPLLGIGKNYELFHWEVILTMITTTLGLVAFASALERFFLRKTTFVETLLFWVAAIGLFWPAYWAYLKDGKLQPLMPEVVKAAAVPAFVSYLALFYIVHLEAVRLGMKALSAEDVPRLVEVLKAGYHYLIPLLVLIYELIIRRHSANLAAFSAIVALVIVVLVRQVLVAARGRAALGGAIIGTVRMLGGGLIEGSRNMLTVALATATAGIIVGVVFMGVSSMIVEVVADLSFGYIIPLLVITAVARLVLGMGMATTAT